MLNGLRVQTANIAKNWDNTPPEPKKLMRHPTKRAAPLSAAPHPNC